MKRHLHMGSALLALAAALAGCGKDAEPGPAPLPPASETPLYWDVRGVERPAGGTRSLVGPTPAEDETADWITLEQACTPTPGGEGKAIGIWADYSYAHADGSTSDIRDLFKGTRIVYDKKENGNPKDWNYEGETQYWLKGGQYKFRAYFPQKLAPDIISSTSASTFAIEYRTCETQEDLCVAYQEVNTAQPGIDFSKPVELRFKHALAAVQFRIQADFPETGHLTGCWLQNAEEKAFADLGILTYGDKEENEKLYWHPGHYPPVTELFYQWKTTADVEFKTEGTGESQTRKQAMAYTASDKTTAGEQYTENKGWVLVLPQPSSGKVQFCFTLRATGDAVYRVTLPEVTEREKNPDGTTIKEYKEYRPGKRYLYTVTITKTELELELSISDWNRRESSTQIHF